MKAEKPGRTGQGMVLNQCLEALALVLEFNNRDCFGHQHAIRVGEGCVLVGEKLGLGSEPRRLQKLYYAGLLHDIGKIAVKTCLLAKKGPLTEEEFGIIKKHSIYGSRILSSLPGLSELGLWIRWHHEWWDGSGYPDCLYQNDIPIEVQILSAVDCFDSLQTPRLDRDRFSLDEAYELVEQETGSHFNPEIIKLVREMAEEGALVPEQSSDKFLELKKKYINVPITPSWDGQGDDGDLAGIYPVLRLFARVIDAKHSYTRGHSTRVSLLAEYLAGKMKLPQDEVARAEVAGLLHDAGKVCVPTEILDKPGCPSEDEWAIIRQHPQLSYDILSKVSALKEVAEISASHHERYDGSGYPHRLEGDSISLIAQIVAVSDTYDAITSTRAYRQARPPEAAREIIREGTGTKFHPDVGAALLDTPAKNITALFDMHDMNNPAKAGLV